MKCLFIGTTGVQRVICLFWMRSGGFDKVSWIKALEGGLKDRSQGLLGVRQATVGRLPALCVADGPIKRYFSLLFLCWTGNIYLCNLLKSVESAGVSLRSPLFCPVVLSCFYTLNDLSAALNYSSSVSIFSSSNQRTAFLKTPNIFYGCFLSFRLQR